MGRDQKESLDGDLARRLQRALTAGEQELFDLVREQSPEVLSALLKNPALTEEHLLIVLRRVDLPQSLVARIASSSQFEEHHRLRVAVFRNPATPSHLALALLSRLHLFELADSLLIPSVPPDHRVAAERAVIQQLPTVPLGVRLTLARRGSAAIVEALLAEGDSRVVDACLDSPRLTEGSLVRFLNGPKAMADSISAIGRHERWKTLPGIRRAMLRHPRTPAVWFLLFLPSLSVSELRELAASRRLSKRQKELVADALARRGR
jgi:hypothetical protein